MVGLSICRIWNITGGRILAFLPMPELPDCLLLPLKDQRLHDLMI